MTSEWKTPARADRFRRNREIIDRYCQAGSDHAEVARRFQTEDVERVLDVGCGDGTLAALLNIASIQSVGVDISPSLIRGAVEKSAAAQAEARHLPFERASFDAAAALWVLYLFPDPTIVLTEIHRILRTGGLVAATAPSRYNDPELAELLPHGRPSSFDAETAPALVEGVFEAIEVQRWDAPLLRLPTRDALREYAVSRGAETAAAAEFASSADLPFVITKRGALIFGRKR